MVLPLPVGPVTSTMPCGRVNSSRKRFSISGGNPSRSRPNAPELWESKRITTDSPCCVGMVEMRMSIDWFFSFTLKRPSCGRRFSEISKPDINFRRKASAVAILGSASVCICNTPSMRKRICKRASCGSMWTSEARICAASSNTDCSNLTTGASSRL